MQTYLFVFLLFCETFLSCHPGAGKNRVLAAEIQSAGFNQIPPPGMPVSDVVFQSDDAGTTWRDISDGLPDDMRPNTIGSANGIVLLGMDNGIISTSATTGLWERDPLFDETIFEIFPGATGPYVLTQWHGLYQNLYGTGVWAPMHHNLGDKTVQTILETSNGALFFGCENSIYRSSTKGNSWLKVAEGFDVKTITEANGVLIAGCRNGLLRSADGGETWTPVLKTRQPVVTIRSLNNEIIALVENYTKDDNNAETRLVFSSSDNGLNWQCINGSLPVELRSIYALERLGNTLVACSNAGIFRSSDEGKTWEKVREAPTGRGQSFRMTVSGQSIYVLVAAGC
ncbi:MAG TPA: YCF48-related protein [Saprospiraceae bacterium]|nr:YCF48-related protein [Saprospiraceae bacterium]